MSAPGRRGPNASGWRPLASSLVVHAIVLALFAGGFWWSRATPPPPPTLAIEATVVDARTLQTVQPARSAPVPRPAAIEPPVPDEIRDVERASVRPHS